MKGLAYLFILILLVGSVGAVKVVREGTYSGGELRIKIGISNDFDVEKEFIIYEQLKGEFIGGEPSYCLGANNICYMKWHTKIPTGKIKVINYEVKPYFTGQYDSAPTKVEVNNKSYYSEPFAINVDCILDGICGSGENYLNCRDCSYGMEDGVCDFQVGICDLDCENDSDCEYPELSFFRRLKDWFLGLFR